MNKNDWNAGQYMKFAGERTQPSIDLLNRVHNNPAQILDMGCGPGNSTNVLFEKFKDADIMGIDASQNMLDRAKNDYPHIIFKKCIVPDELDVIDKKFDLIFSNACIHWIPNQTELLNAVIKKLNNGGSLAVQIPLIQEAPFYKILFETIIKVFHREDIYENKVDETMNDEEAAKFAEEEIIRIAHLPD